MASASRMFALFLLASLAVLATSFPSEGNLWQRESSHGDDVVIVPLENRDRETSEGSEEDDYGGGYSSPWGNSFGSFYDQMRDMMRNLRNQMREVLKRLPQDSIVGTNGTSVLISPSWDDLPGNSTSTTKVINGHVVTVNETTYTKGSGDSSAVFHIKVVNIEPVEKETKNEEGSEEVETVEDTWGSKPSSSLNFDDTKLSPQMAKWLFQHRGASTSFSNEDKRKRLFKKPVSRRVYVPQSEEVPDTMNSIDDSVEVFHRENEAGRNPGQVVDLSRDILVNKLMSDQQSKGGLIALHPDVELLDISDGKVIGESEDSYLQQKFQKPDMHEGVWVEN